jgi:hypothetical protein
LLAIEAMTMRHAALHPGAVLHVIRNLAIDSRTLVWMTASLIGLTIVLWAPQVMGDGDTYLHVAAGEWMLRHATIPKADPFSYTFAGSPWVAHEWLAELIMGGVYRIGGWDGVVSLAAAATALTFGLLAYHLQRWLSPLAAAVALAIAGSCVASSLLVRPHLLVLPLLELWVAGLLMARERGDVPWRLLPVMVLWANMHGSFVFGVLLLVPFAIEAVADASTARLRCAAGWTACMLATVLFAMMTPHGWRGLLFPFQLMHMQSLTIIYEWRRPDVLTFQPIEGGLLLAIYICVTRRVRLPLMRLAILGGLTYMAFAHNRNAMVSAIAGSLILAPPIGKALGMSAVGRTGRGDYTSVGFMLAAVAMIASRFAVPTGGYKMPEAALAHVPPALASQPVLNDYGFGGYLIYSGIQPFIDGRADMYGDAFMLRYDETMHAEAALRGTLGERRIGWTILPASSPAAAMMDAMPGWHRLYADAVAVVHVRSAGGNKATD